MYAKIGVSEMYDVIIIGTGWSWIERSLRVPEV